MNNLSVQRIFERIGDEGCYFLSIIKGCGRDPLFDAPKVYVAALQKGYIEEDCYVADPIGLCRICGRDDITNVVKATNYNDVPQKPSIRIAVYKSQNYRHFVLINEDGTIWDPYEPSNTVKVGKIESYRLFY